jgi:hypothetical protein
MGSDHLGKHAYGRKVLKWILREVMYVSLDYIQQTWDVVHWSFFEYMNEPSGSIRKAENFFT